MKITIRQLSVSGLFFLCVRVHSQAGDVDLTFEANVVGDIFLDEKLDGHELQVGDVDGDGDMTSARNCGVRAP